MTENHKIQREKHHKNIKIVLRYYPNIYDEGFQRSLKGIVEYKKKKKTNVIDIIR